MTHTIERWIVVHRNPIASNLMAATFRTKELALEAIVEKIVDDPIALLPWSATFKDGDGLGDGLEDEK